MPRTKKAMNGKPTNAEKIRRLAKELIDEPDRWMDAENDQLGGLKPIDMVGTPREQALLDLLHAIKYGMFS